VPGIDPPKSALADEKEERIPVDLTPLAEDEKPQEKPTVPDSSLSPPSDSAAPSRPASDGSDAAPPTL
ncbi:MAG: hypothetical protein N3A66_11885, partial [Planctomycetota bacterium]|nr:hypothetical protein [Planctomycetota bacterium]